MILSNIIKFFQYDKNKILSTPAEYFYTEIFALKCGNIATKKQMESLAYNIHIFEQIENDYGSLNNFYEAYPADTLAKIISSGKYKLKYIGYALAWEFLRHVGIDGAKSSPNKDLLFRINAGVILLFGRMKDSDNDL